MTIEHEVTIEVKEKKTILFTFTNTLFLEEDYTEYSEHEYVSGDYMRHRIIRSTDSARNKLKAIIFDKKTKAFKRLPTDDEVAKIQTEQQDELIDTDAKYEFRVKGQTQTVPEKTKAQADKITDDAELEQMERIIQQRRAELAEAA